MFKTLFSRRALTASGLLASSLLVTARAWAQQPITVTLPPITVTAQKEPQDPQNLPVSVSTVLGETLMLDALTSVSQAGWFDNLLRNVGEYRGR